MLTASSVNGTRRESFPSCTTSRMGPMNYYTKPSRSGRNVTAAGSRARKQLSVRTPATQVSLLRSVRFAGHFATRAELRHGSLQTLIPVHPLNGWTHWKQRASFPCPVACSESTFEANLYRWLRHQRRRTEFLTTLICI